MKSSSALPSELGLYRLIAVPGSVAIETNVTFLAIGDVHGHWECMIEAIALAEAILGRVPNLVLQVGDAGAHRNEEDLAGCHTPKKYRSLGDFSAPFPRVDCLISR